MNPIAIRTRERWAGKRTADMSPQDVEGASAAGYEPGPDGYFTGRDPREMTTAELQAMGHAQMSPMEAIRAKCLDCCAGSPHEVRLCVAVACPSWPFRTGKNPWRTPISEERRAVLRERGIALAARMKSGAPDADKIKGSDEETESDEE